jgi:type IV secretory pathway VirB10-like protein
MTSPDENGASTARETAPRSALIDRRVRPPGVLPRHLQTWLMVVLALVILLIIFVTGRRAPLPASPPAQAGTAAPSALPPDRIRTYQQRIAEGETRMRQELADARPDEARPSALLPESPVETPAVDSLAEERRRRDYQSLFADNVALSRRPPGQGPQADGTGDIQRLEEIAARAWDPQGPATAAGVTTAVDQRSSRVAEDSTSAVAGPSSTPVTGGTVSSPEPRQTAPIAPAGPLHRLLEGTLIDTVLMNRLDGSLSGAVTCLVTTPVYSHSRQHVVIPAGARVLGTASPVQTWGESRLAVRFHRLIMPDGRTYSLERFTGLNQSGDAGLKDQVNRHYLQVFGASLAIGALAGLAQSQTRGGADPAYGFEDAYRQGLGGSLATSAGRVLDRFLNVLPTVTIREGHRVKVYLTNDLDLPEYGAKRD